MDDKLLNCTLIVIAIFCIYILFKEDIENSFTSNWTKNTKPSWMNDSRLNRFPTYTQWGNTPILSSSSIPQSSSTQSVGTKGYNASDVVQAGRYAAPSWRTKTRKAKTNTYGDYDQVTDSSQFDQLLQGAGTGVASGNALGSSGSDWSARLKRRSQKYDRFEDPVQSQGFIEGEYRDEREY